MNKILSDKFLVSLLVVLILSSLFPLQGTFEVWFAMATRLAVGLLFFLHGARLPSRAVKAGVAHWRLHVMVLTCTFLLFPLLGLLAGFALPALVASPFYIGVLYLCILPSTVQSSIAFTSIARGNVPAALISASASNIIGIFITPLLVGLLLTSTLSGEVFSVDIFFNILIQLFFPFVAGQIAQPWWGNFLRQRKNLTDIVDRGSILMVVILAFSEAANAHVWSTVSWSDLGMMLFVNGILLGIILSISWFGSKWLGFSLADRITIMFCGSKKSLASGAPMAHVIFSQVATLNIGVIILPVMLFHQIQLMVCTLIAQHLSCRRED